MLQTKTCDNSHDQISWIKKINNKYELERTSPQFGLIVLLSQFKVHQPNFMLIAQWSLSKNKLKKSAKIPKI